MPHPHEQKLHEVVNSLTSASFRSRVAARIAVTSRRPPTASPAPPAKVSLNSSLRFMPEAFWLASCTCDSLMVLLRVIRRRLRLGFLQQTCSAVGDVAGSFRREFGLRPLESPEYRSRVRPSGLTAKSIV